MDFEISEYPGLQFGSIYCIGSNFAKHIEEMNSYTAADPTVFLKPRSSLIFNGESIILPPVSGNVHHEVELVVLIGKKTHAIKPGEAAGAIRALAVGLDITARDIQADAKKNGLPWSLSKGFDTFAPVGNFTDFHTGLDIENLDLSVTVNGETRQAGNTSNMLFSAAEIISYLSEQFTLYPGDLIFTGTPEGVSQIKPGDTIDANLGDNLSTLRVYVKS
jgi:2-keto-4-pentenoate hydratase/2-oxohepta-3-ene-1,7-dioic acid hydratase in catechol pathway